MLETPITHYQLQDFNFYGGSEGKQCLIYVLDLQTSVVDKLPDDVTFVTKQVGNGT
jgi:hypothetical protein